MSYVHIRHLNLRPEFTLYSMYLCNLGATLFPLTLITTSNSLICLRHQIYMEYMKTLKITCINNVSGKCTFFFKSKYHCHNAFLFISFILVCQFQCVYVCFTLLWWGIKICSAYFFPFYFDRIV